MKVKWIVYSVFVAWIIANDLIEIEIDIHELFNERLMRCAKWTHFLILKIGEWQYICDAGFKLKVHLRNTSVLGFWQISGCASLSKKKVNVISMKINLRVDDLKWLCRFFLSQYIPRFCIVFFLWN